MRKSLLILVSIFLLSFSAKLYSTCPDGYFSASFTIRTPINNCLYTVYYCYKCVSPAPQIGLILDYFYKNDPACTESMGADELIEYFENYLRERFFSWGVCTNVPPPCDPNDPNAYIVLSMSYSKCWYKENSSGTIIWHNCLTIY